MKQAIVIISLALCLVQINAIYTQLNKMEQFCVFKTFESGTNFTGSYVVSGESEDLISLRIFDPSPKVFYEVDKQRENAWELPIRDSGEYKICFKSMDKKNKIISFDLQSSNEKDAKGAATSEHIDEVTKEVRKAYKLLEKVFRNQHYQHTREDTHRKNIGTLESKIKWSAFFKIFVLVVIAVGQIYILTGYFKNKRTIGV